MNIEDQLKQLITARYGTIKDFSKACGVKYTTVMTILSRGVGNASITNIIAICKALGISTDELAEGRIVFTAPKNPHRALEKALFDLEIQMLDYQITFEGETLKSNEISFVKDSFATILEMLKKKRARK